MVVIQQHAKIAWIMLCLFGFSLGGAVNKLVSSGTATVANLALTIALSCGVIAAVRTVFFKKRSTALVWEGGLAFVTADGISVGRYSWEEIRHVEYTRIGGEARLVGHDDSTVDRITQDFFGSNRQTKAFIEIANQFQKESCSDDAG